MLLATMKTSRIAPSAMATKSTLSMLRVQMGNSASRMPPLVRPANRSTNAPFKYADTSSVSMMKMHMQLR
jgi:hypothetical protein